jgi:hypothetical protein
MPVSLDLHFIAGLLESLGHDLGQAPTVAKLLAVVRRV